MTLIRKKKFTNKLHLVLHADKIPFCASCASVIQTGPGIIEGAFTEPTANEKKTLSPYAISFSDRFTVAGADSLIWY